MSHRSSQILECFKCIYWHKLHKKQKTYALKNGNKGFFNSLNIYIYILEFEVLLTDMTNILKKKIKGFQIRKINSDIIKALLFQHAKIIHLYSVGYVGCEIQNLKSLILSIFTTQWLFTLLNTQIMFGILSWNFAIVFIQYPKFHAWKLHSGFQFSSSLIWLSNNLIDNFNFKLKVCWKFAERIQYLLRIVNCINLCRRGSLHAVLSIWTNIIATLL